MKIKKLHFIRSYAHHSNSLASASYRFSCNFSNPADIFDIVFLIDITIETIS